MSLQAELKSHKQTIRAFLRTEVWAEEKLCALLAHAEDKLSMWSCCCLIGVATANHPLRGRIPLISHRDNNSHLDYAHLGNAWYLPCALAAETAFQRLAAPCDSLSGEADELRRRRIRP